MDHGIRSSQRIGGDQWSSCVMKKRRRPPQSESNSQRLIAALEQNLKHTRDPQLRLRLQAAIATFKRKAAA
jgi:hypothetical protein